MNKSIMARKAWTSRMNNVVRVKCKGDTLLKRWVELCLYMVKCSKEAAWLPDNGRGIRTSGWRRHAFIAKLQGDSSLREVKRSLALRSQVGRGWG